jgi:ADP-ribose 1''-phosphate phosphatase
MSSQRGASIKSYFKPTDRVKDKVRQTVETSVSDSSTAFAKNTVSDSQTATTSGKRPLSGSPPAPDPKRPNVTDTSKNVAKHLSHKDLSTGWDKSLAVTTEESDKAKPGTLQLTYHIGDIFEAPENCLLIHACNTQGHWGAGIAKAFHQKYPKAYAAHNKFCAKDHNKTNPVPTGTAQLLAPVDGTPQHWIGCLFTSAKYGKAKDKPDQIIRHTAGSMKILLELVRLADQDGEGLVTQIRICKINSGMFGVPWERTEDALRKIVLQEGWRATIEVWEP